MGCRAALLHCLLPCLSCLLCLLSILHHNFAPVQVGKQLQRRGEANGLVNE